MWTSRFKQYSIAHQQEIDVSLAFTIPREYITGHDLTCASLFHGGIDSPSINAYDPLIKQPVRITKYLCLKSKICTQQYLNHLHERILLTSDLSHPNVRRILSWYIADACLYSVTDIISNTLRQAIQTEKFSFERISHLSKQIIQGTIYLKSKGLCPLTPWYTTNIELTNNDCIRLCSPTISTTKLNGGTVQHHHLWRHAPESLIRMILNCNDFSDNFKEDVWSIGCIIIEMMINTILFRPANDDPCLQLFCIVQYVGGLTNSIVDRFPLHIKKFFSKISFDSHQQRLDRLLEKIFCQYTYDLTEYCLTKKANLFDLLKQILQFHVDKRLTLECLLAHPFYSLGIKRIPSNKYPTELQTTVELDDLVHLCTKYHLKQSRWMLTLKERCLFELILHRKNLRRFNLQQYGLSQFLQFEIRKLILFLTGN